jgi:hypothetical protein
MVAFLMKVAEPEPRCFEQRGSLPPSKPQYNFSLKCFGLDGSTDDCAYGADDVAGASTPAKNSENYVF